MTHRGAAACALPAGCGTVNASATTGGRSAEMKAQGARSCAVGFHGRPAGRPAASARVAGVAGTGGSGQSVPGMGVAAMNLPGMGVLGCGTVGCGTVESGTVHVALL
jgi:hypothetical protein